MEGLLAASLSNILLFLATLPTLPNVNCDYVIEMDILGDNGVLKDLKPPVNKAQKPAFEDYPFRNVTLPWDVRVDDLVGRLTLDELIGQLSHGGAGTTGGPAPAIPRLGILPYQYNTECLRGDVMAGNATSYPQALGLAASFSTELLEQIAVATSEEVRARHTYSMSQGIYRDHTGLGCFSPLINIMRHPLWGRNQETYGEDPFLSGSLGVAYVKGLQGNDSRYLRTNAGCKHVDAYNGPENLPVSRFGFNSMLSMRDLHTTFLPQFKMCVDGGTYSVMCSYSRVNGIPSCANEYLLTEVLRKQWKFKGFVMSDEGAVSNIINFHKFLDNPVDTAAVCLNAGLNLELSFPNGLIVFDSLKEAISQGKTTVQQAYDQARPLFYTRMRLGEFDPPDMNPYMKLNLSTLVQSPEHQALSLKAAMNSFVLLKNDKGFLPIPKKISKVVGMVGPYVTVVDQLFGDYSADVDKTFISPVYDILKFFGNNHIYGAGCSDTKCVTYNESEVRDVASKADIVFLTVGTGQAIETEGNDRSNMDLPGYQSQLVNDVIRYAKGSIVMLVFSAGPVDLQVPDASDKVISILQCFFPAQTAGLAIYNVLTLNTTNGDANPAARLPYTWYTSLYQVPPMIDYSMSQRTYRYFTGDPLYPFGYGLSYSKFEYSALRISPTVITPGGTVNLAVAVKNIGPFKGDEVVQLYMRWLNATVTTPQLQLVAFQRISLANGETKTVHFEISAERMQVWIDMVHGYTVQPGVYEIFVGGQQPVQLKKNPSNILTGQFIIRS